MQVERWTGRVTGGPLEDVYVYAAPVRLWHWLTVVLFAVSCSAGSAPSTSSPPCS